MIKITIIMRISRKRIIKRNIKRKEIIKRNIRKSPDFRSK
jgi:hypothetical protein